jgi:hypothetical protein
MSRTLPSLAVAVFATTLAAHAGAQTITFPPADFPGGNGATIADGYGATAAVATTYRVLPGLGNTTPVPGAAVQWWNTGYSTLGGVAYGGSSAAGSVAEVGLQRLGSGTITLTDFDIGSWQNTTRTAFVRVLGWSDFSTILSFSAPIGVAAFDFAGYLTANGLAAPTRTDGFRIQFTQDANPATADVEGRGAFDAGIDNIAFEAGRATDPGQNVVPEPSTYVLLATGLGTLGTIARRRRATGRG